MSDPIVWPGNGHDNDLERWEKIHDVKDRDPTVPCPDCGDLYLYTDSYDKCYKCGRGILETK